jgi:archaellum biogenesis ATPase FlaH
MSVVDYFLSRASVAAAEEIVAKPVKLVPQNLEGTEGLSDKGLAALFDAERGFQVHRLHYIVEVNAEGEGKCSCFRGFECGKSAGKHPIEVGWQRSSTRDRATIIAWWRRNPQYNIGCDTEKTGVVMLDVDVSEGKVGTSSYAALFPADEFPTMYDKSDVRTHSGGAHRYRRYGVGQETLKTNASKIALHVDMRAAAGNAVLPGSVGVEGPYTITDPDFSVATLPVLPQNAYEKIVRLCATAKTLAKTEFVDGVEFVPHGMRHEYAKTWLARMHGATKASPDVLFAALSEHFAQVAPDADMDDMRRLCDWYADKDGDVVGCTPESLFDREADSDMTTALSDVKLEAVDFLWGRFLPKGKLVVLAGEPKDGKSTLAVTICAALTAGLALPGDASGVYRVPQTVIYFTAEDGIGDTILPRAINAGANLANFRTATLAYSMWEQNKRVDRQITLANTEKLRDLIEKHRPSLIVVDPLQAFIGASVDFHKANSVRPILAGVAKLAEDFGVTVLIIAHLNKSDSKGAHRILGSIDFVAAARCVLMTARDPLTLKRYLCIERATYGGDNQALMYTVEDSPPIPIPGSDQFANSAMVVFGDEIEKLKYEDIIRRTEDGADKSSGLERSKQIIQDVLQPGVWAESDSVRQKAGVSVSTFKRARTALEDEGFVVASRPVKNSGGQVERWEIGREFAPRAARPARNNTDSAWAALR